MKLFGDTAEWEGINNEIYVYLMVIFTMIYEPILDAKVPIELGIRESFDFCIVDCACGLSPKYPKLYNFKTNEK